MTQKMIRQVFGRASLVWAMLMATPLAAAPADDVRTLLQQGKPAEAYRAALRSPGEIGNPAFDYHYGIAAINAGKPSEGVLALERYLLTFPDSATARLELARGYYLLGDDARSRDEFEAILAARPAANVAVVVQEYLAAISARESRHKTTYAMNVEVGAGHDSNVQSGVADPNISLPIFGAVTLTDSAVAKRDRFSSVALGGRIQLPVRRHWSAFAQIGADLKQYSEADTYDQNTYSAAGGFSITRGTGLYRLTVGKTRQTLDNSRYRDTLAFGTDYGRQWGANGVFTLGTQLARFEYAGDNAIRNADYYSLQSGYRYLATSVWRTEFDLNLSVAREKNTVPALQNLSRDLWGGRIGASVSPFQAWTLTAGATYLASDYRAEDPLLQVTRLDDYTAFDFSATYTISSAWSLRADYTSARNKSNLPLYEYRRKAGQLKLRYDFR